MKNFILFFLILFGVEAFCCGSRECVRTLAYVSAVSNNHPSFNNAPDCVRATPPNEVVPINDILGPMWFDCEGIDILNFNALSLTNYCDDEPPFFGAYNYYTESYSHCNNRECYDQTDFIEATPEWIQELLCRGQISWGSEKRSFVISVQINSQCHNDVGYWWKATRTYAAGEVGDYGDPNLYHTVIPQGTTVCDSNTVYTCANS